MIFVNYMFTCMLMGASCVLFLQGVLKSFTVLKTKYLMIAAMLGLWGSVGVAVIVYLFLYDDPEYTKYYGIVLGVLWFIMILATTWLYVFRILTLGRPIADRFIKNIPYIYIIIEIPTSTTIMLKGFDYKYHGLYIIVSLGFTVIAILLESFMYIVLVRKLYGLLKNKNSNSRSMVQNISVGLVVLVILKLLIVAAKLLQSDIDYSLRPFAMLLRLNIVLQFYGNQLNRLSKERYISIELIESSDSKQEILLE